MSKYDEIRDYGTGQFTLENDAAIEWLKYIGRHWPDSLWLFAADGKLYVMKYDENGDYKLESQYIMDKIDIASGSATGGVKPIENSDIKRFVDYEAQVVCYTVVRSSSISIDCMPLSQTALPKE